MIQVRISLNSIHQVKLLNKIAAQQPFDVDLISGGYRVSAKSIMGIFSINFNETLILELDTADHTVLAAFTEFIVPPTSWRAVGSHRPIERQNGR